MRRRNLIYSLIFFLLFLVVMVLVFTSCTEGFDNAVYQFVISFRSPALDTFFTTITRLGNTGTILLLIIIFVLAFRNRESLYLVISALDCFLLNTILKYIIQRARPDGLRLIVQGGYSFPSGHAMMSICVYGYLLYFSICHIKNKVLKYIVSILLVLVILSIGISRIYIGVHYASDVLAGYLLACSYLLLLIEVMRKSTALKG